MGKWWWSIAVIVVFMMLALPVQAQGGITVLNDDYSYTFNRELVFDLTVQSDERIPADSVELRYSIGLKSDVVNRRQPEYEPGKTLTLHVQDDLDQGEIPPASTITYHWEITDEAGNTFETDEKSFVYMDDRFDWKSKTQGPITIYWYGRVDADRILTAATDALVRLETTIGYRKEKPINIVLYQDRSDLRDAMPPRGGDADDHIVTLGSIVAPDIMLLLDHPEIENTISHELTHMVVGELTDNPFAEIPLWLNEGLAMYNQNYIEPVYEKELRDATRKGELHTVRRLVASTRAIPSQVNLWYAEVWSIVDFLISEYGEDKMAQLLDIISQGVYEDDALMEVYGFDREGLTVRWWKWLGADIPPALRGESAKAPENSAETTTPDERSQTLPPEKAPVGSTGSESPPVEQPASPPAAGLACCAGLLPLGLILLVGLRFRSREIG